MRRGLTEKEISVMPVTQYYELWIFDTFLEPQGPVAEDIHSALNRYTMYMTSPNMTKKAAKGIKLSEFMTLNKGNVFKTPEELALIEKEKNINRNKAILSQFTDPTVLTQIEKRTRGEVNG